MTDEEQTLGPVDEPPVDTWGSFPSDSEYADFHVIIRRPEVKPGVQVFDRGWDILFEKDDGSVGWNEWADDLAEAAWFFRDVRQVDPKELEELPAWVWPGKLVGVVWDDVPPDPGHHH